MNDIKAKTTDETVADYLTANSIGFVALPHGERANACGGNTTMDAWSVAFTSAARPHTPEYFEFFTGMGLRKKTPWIRHVQQNSPEPRPGTAAYERWVKTFKPVRPSAASVLHCLLSDATACEQSFRDWCSDYGYDEDSRKAEATYRACQEAGDKLRKIFTGQQVRELRELLQDY